MSSAPAGVAPTVLPPVAWCCSLSEHYLLVLLLLVVVPGQHTLLAILCSCKQSGSDSFVVLLQLHIAVVGVVLTPLSCSKPHLQGSRPANPC